MQATEKQLDFISSLAIDCNFTQAQRLDYFRTNCNRHPSNPQIESINDITLGEASLIIDKLIKLKDEIRERSFNSRG